MKISQFDKYVVESMYEYAEQQYGINDAVVVTRSKKERMIDLTGEQFNACVLIGYRLEKPNLPKPVKIKVNTTPKHPLIEERVNALMFSGALDLMSQYNPDGTYITLTYGTRIVGAPYIRHLTVPKETIGLLVQV